MNAKKTKPPETPADKALRGVAVLVGLMRELSRRVGHLEAEVDGLRADAAIATAEVDEELEAIRTLVKTNSSPRPRPGKRS